MATKKTLQLNISERLSSLAILNGFKGNLDKLALILEDIKGFSITEEEWEKAERKVTPMRNEAGQDTTQWNWDDVKGGEKDIEIYLETADYLRTSIKEKSDKGELTLQDKPLISLQTKLA